ncbi:uncharacterized protein [Mytilus edulis]|uniref:uncharacterized protein n=1 Tax=Mytilus edulis TaxID=6550 RepID=UPI0039EE6E4C
MKNITNHQGGFGCLPTAMETTPGTDLARIEYYRNYLAQLDGGKVRSIDFNAAWDIITGAIGRLGGQKIKQDCDHLRIRTLDQTNKEIIEDIKCSNDEIKNLKESLNSLKIYHELLLEGDHRELKRSYEELQEDHTEMTDEIKRLKTSYDDTVPCNIRARFKETLKAWKENDDKMFIKTRAAKLVFKCIKEHNCVTITASSGVGKTAILRHVALQMAEEEFNVLLVTEPCDIVRFYNPREKILFVIDDFCGNFSVKQRDIKRWEPVMEDIKKLLGNKRTRIIAACHLHVYKDKQFESLSVFKSCECNLLSENICLLKLKNNQ